MVEKRSNKKPFISVTEMTTTSLYVDKNGKLFRRYQEKIQYRDTSGEWKELKVSFDALANTKVRKY